MLLPSLKSSWGILFIAGLRFQWDLVVKLVRPAQTPQAGGTLSL